MKQALGTANHHVVVEQVSVKNYDNPDGTCSGESDDAVEITVKTRENHGHAVCITLARDAQIALFHQLNNILFHGAR